MEDLGLKFQCNAEDDSWEGVIKSHMQYGSHYHIEVSAKGSGITIYFGQGFGCWFVCIPDWAVGLRIGSLRNVGHNEEKLMDAMKNEIDGISVAYAIMAYAEHFKIQEHDDTNEILKMLKEAGFKSRDK